MNRYRNTSVGQTKLESEHPQSRYSSGVYKSPKSARVVAAPGSESSKSSKIIKTFRYGRQDGREDAKERHIRQKLQEMAQLKKTKDFQRRQINNINMLQINLHQKQTIQMEVQEENIERALHEIDRDPRDGKEKLVPIEQRGGEVLEQVNEVFNLMAMKIDMDAKARVLTAGEFGNGPRSYKTKPEVIYVKNPRDRLLLMTEHLD